MACGVCTEPHVLRALPELVMCVGGRPQLLILGVGDGKVQPVWVPRRGVCGRPEFSGFPCEQGKSVALLSPGPALLWGVSFPSIPHSRKCRYMPPVLALPPTPHLQRLWLAIRGGGVGRTPEGYWGASARRGVLVELLLEA